MVVLSLFDAVCCGLLALHRAGIAVKEYWRVENDYWCNKVAERYSEARLCETDDVKQLVGDEVGPGYPIWAEVGLIIIIWVPMPRNVESKCEGDGNG